MKKRKILVAMSGGVDSSVAAALLKEEGHDVAGATMRTWRPAGPACENERVCCGARGMRDARDVAEHLEIPFWVFDFEKEFKKRVVDYFASEYKKGRTPNPCIACNEHIKFRLFLRRARQLGYDTIATGHYSRLSYDRAQRRFYLREGIDSVKDQSYVLFGLSQDVLCHLCLPVGRLTKQEIRRKAKERNLPVMDKPESQEICFIPGNDYGAFLKKEYLGGKKNMPGIIRMQDGKILGQHAGHFHYTYGQRRGLGVPYKERLYVVGIHPGKNEVIVGTKEDILGQKCAVSRIRWSLRPPGRRADFHVKIRYLHQKATARVKLLKGNTAEVFFGKPQMAITPGQAAVFYKGSRVVGGGWIKRLEVKSKRSETRN